MVTILGRAGLADPRRMMKAKIGQPHARPSPGYPFDCWRLYRPRRAAASPRQIPESAQIPRPNIVDIRNRPAYR